jgi:hypothetical protein
MGAGKMAGPGWQQVPVLLRSDIVAAAERKRLDLNDECNRALASRLGIAFQPLPKAPSPGASRVIVAPDAAPAKRVVAATAPPVINAEDPTVPGKVLREKKEKKTPMAPKPRESAAPRPATPVPPSVTTPAKPVPKTRVKGRKGDAIQRFVSTRIVREAEEGPDAIIAKDELYQRFERWCRDQDYAAIPERRIFSVALKNKYAFAERSVGGIPSWISIRIK